MRVLIADGAHAVRSALRLYIEQGEIEVHVVEAASVGDVAAIAARAPIDVALIDWTLPVTGAGAAIDAVRSGCPDAYIVVLSGRPEAAQPALDAGADDFISKGDPPESLAGIFEQVRASGVSPRGQGSAPLCRTRGRRATAGHGSRSKPAAHIGPLT